MRRELIVSAFPGEWRAALVEDGVAVEVAVERGEGFEAGSIHLGRVLRLLPALGAALVDIGGDRPAFLPQSEIVPRGRRLDEGQRVIVQIRREAQGGKAAQATLRVVLRCRFAELLPGRSDLGGDDALTPEERTHLLATVAAAAHTPAALVPPSLRMRGEGRGEGLPQEPAIGLRVMEPTPIETLINEAKILCGRWLDISESAAHLDPPVRLHPASNFAAALAGTLPAADRVVVDEPGVIPEIRAAFLDAEVAHVPESQWPVDLYALFDEALSPTIALAGGGAVHIEAVRAATLIDVDSGTPESGSPERTALAINLAAAVVIARQLRLRRFGGSIVVDFVGLDDRGARERVRTALARALVADPARPEILGWTRLGHLELVRPRRLRPLAEVLLEAPSCGAPIKTAVTVAHEALRRLRREERAQPGRRWRLTVAPDVAAALAGPAASALAAFEQISGRKTAVAANPDLARGQFHISPA
jgi:ribonuclease G